DELAAKPPHRVTWRRWQPVSKLAHAYASGSPPTPAQTETVRRAVRTLNRKGLVETADLGRSRVGVRLPLTAAEADAERAERNRRLDLFEQDPARAWLLADADPLPTLRRARPTTSPASPRREPGRASGGGLPDFVASHDERLRDSGR